MVNIEGRDQNIKYSYYLQFFDDLAMDSGLMLGSNYTGSLTMLDVHDNDLYYRSIPAMYDGIFDY